jgi:hypothetical protein
MSFVELANTDDELMRWMPEAILMASAFEQMLGVEDKRELVNEFEALFAPFGSVTVEAAMALRPAISIEPSTLRHSRDGLFTRNGFRNYTIFEANLCTTERTGPARGVGLRVST